MWHRSMWTRERSTLISVANGVWPSVSREISHDTARTLSRFTNIYCESTLSSRWFFMLFALYYLAPSHRCFTKLTCVRLFFRSCYSPSGNNWLHLQQHFADNSWDAYWDMALCQEQQLLFAANANGFVQLVNVRLICVFLVLNCVVMQRNLTH